MNVAFRVDASRHIGIGHFVRCLTLADAVSQHGGRIRFVSRYLLESLRHQLRERGYEFAEIDPRVPDDADSSARALEDGPWHWVVVDHYALGAEWEDRVRGTAERILAIDDLADRAHRCDVLLDQNYFGEGERRYAGKVPDACRLLVGPRYALLRPEYRAQRDVMRARTHEIRRVLVFFGGTDPPNMTGLALEALSRPAFRHLPVDVVCGSDPARRREVDRAAAARPGTVVYGPRPHLADLMAAADLALGAGGTTTWERMCLGVRSLVITLAENQEPITQWLAHEGLITLVGRSSDVTADDIADALVKEIGAQGHVTSIDQGMALCDGLGVPRVVDVMLQTSGS